MSEQSTEDTQTSTPWLAIAVGILVLGVVVVIGLGTVEAPAPPSEPQTVQHVQADLGDWAPFADAGQRSDAAEADLAEVD